jgi:hypothetical protein
MQRSGRNMILAAQSGQPIDAANCGIIESCDIDSHESTKHRIHVPGMQEADQMTQERISQQGCQPLLVPDRSHPSTTSIIRGCDRRSLSALEVHHEAEAPPLWKAIEAFLVVAWESH